MEIVREGFKKAALGLTAPLSSIFFPEASVSAQVADSFWRGNELFWQVGHNRLGLTVYCGEEYVQIRWGRNARPETAATINSLGTCIPLIFIIRLF